MSGLDGSVQRRIVEHSVTAIGGQVGGETRADTCHRVTVGTT
jgi:hypothetical protein